MKTYTYTFTEDEREALLFALDYLRSLYPCIRDNTREKEQYMHLSDKIALYPDAVGKKEDVPVLKKYIVAYVNTALGEGHYSHCEVQAENEEGVPEQFYRTKRTFCHIKKITEK